MDDSEKTENGSAMERNLASHIFTTSSLMVGICITIISVIHSDGNSNSLATIVDDIIGINSLIFLLACFLSYAVLRGHGFRKLHRLETIADSVFLLGMSIMAVACILFVWAII